jgi:hypothetical protein
MANAEISKDWLQQAKDEFAAGQKRQDVTDALTGKVVNQQLATQDQANQWAQQDRARTLSTFQPLQDQFINTAKDYGSQANQDAAAATAQAGVQQAAAAQQGDSQRQMESMGVNPNSGRFAGIQRAADTQIALGSAGAANQARQTVRNNAISLTGDAINMGNGLASSAASAYGIGTNAGNSAVGNNASANQNFYANSASRNGAYGGAVGANSSAGSLMNSSYGIAQQGISSYNAANAQNNASNMSGLGSIAGAGVSLFL